ncbi:MAG: hypothetical protein JWQ09_5073, partial [Segetibacter sp.]|nr:hypothetical protein [Segetibacter sp.]
MIRNSFFIPVFTFIYSISFGQTFDPNTVNNSIIRKQIELISKNENINADSTWNILKSWNNYPAIKLTGKDYLFVYVDS